MNKFLTILSIAVAVIPLAILYNVSLCHSILIAILVAVVAIVGFKIEKLLKTHGNAIINKLIYMVTKSEGDFSYESKRFTYEYITREKLKAKKEFRIKALKNSIDRTPDRYSWSADSSLATEKAIVEGQEIKDKHQQELWTCYSIYFNRELNKGDIINTGCCIENLLDEKRCAAPFLASSILEKTKHLTLNVIVPASLNPLNAKLKIYSVLNTEQELSCEDVLYDNVVGGYSVKIDYPRKGWRYVLSWDFQD